MSNPETPRVLSLIDKWVRLYESGWSTVDISNQYHVSKATVYLRLKEAGVQLRTRSDVKIGDKHPQWKGDRVSYKVLHSWVRRNKPIPSRCEGCGEQKKLDAANISQNYLRDLNDWEWLCRRCHMNKDGRIKNLVSYRYLERV